ncbi:coproporphyrinogen dehydrogenase HemZ [Clostridium formicaceticum]|uniref:Coproporphyrinogen dehydrogenase HemZ n=1 Tax=Clostridium formicaceticum TaxID=1497 RepID=A0AAC9WG41_9CLOT|nr:coproporphyrinogen dehydrogenase HemZ [Clostridium formicaceticum]AOY76953.1 coproporphyrinogen dehydrogenase HemZ [Clostridium formicaceticum]ARE87436.1 Oxygen-independent coproporphyrinogen-III oxidase 2 [Clostridium formicaceticum]
MVKVILIGHSYDYEVKELLKLFYDAEDIAIFHSEDTFDITAEKDCIVSKIMVQGDLLTAHTMININNHITSFEKAISLEKRDDMKKIAKQLIKVSVFQLLQKEKKKNLPWGFLTGIRPTKIVHEFMEKGMKDQEIIDKLMKDYFIVKEKALLLLEVAKIEHAYIYPINENKISVYVSIPFCPTRCIYCSFPSNPLEQFSKYVDDYVEALCQEIKGTAEILNKKGKEVETIYIGGGTPTTLSIKQFSKLFDEIAASFNLSSLKEFTVEAGRPDTIDKEKLLFFKKSGVTRISINPQTMNDCTLKEIGRSHSVKETIEAYRLAQEVGFYHINMDMIIGLPGENLQMIQNTLEEITKLSPSNLTVHTLAIKNASKLKEQQYHQEQKNPEIIEMLEMTERYARQMGLRPYYMYRQKHMVGNLENIGYGKAGFECIYNIQIMEEKQTIIAMGAGAVSKIVFPKENRLERVPNIKNLEQYIERVEEMVQRKKKQLI